MPHRLLLGDEAVAQGALDAGIAGAFSYPGTPATEIFEFLLAARASGAAIAARWSANEKVAYEEALGMSYAGRRALVPMKHVGLNVAADPFVNSALTGVNGGLVLVVADDPGMHSSQNEQDSRHYAELAQVPLFEPGDQQEAYELTRAAFDYSETVGLPVVVRMVTRLAHSRSRVRFAGNAVQPPPRPLPAPGSWTLVPAVARRCLRRLVDLQPRLLADAEAATARDLALAGPRGVIAVGIACNYLREVAGGDRDLSVLRVHRYPLPVAQVRALVDHCSEVLVAEEGHPFVEQRLRGLLGIPGKAIRGKLTGDLPRTGELSPEALAAALGRAAGPAPEPLAGLANRPPQLCAGCPHADSFRAIVAATEGLSPLIFGDIGCYTLGVMPPYRAVHTCVDMGASIAMAHGAAQAGAWPVLCAIGDSTFGHSGMTALLGAARHDADMTVFVLDNAAVAMTGAQDSLASGERLLAILRGLGVAEEHLHVVEPLPKHHDANVERIRAAIAHRGLSVVVARRPCIHLKKRAAEPAAASERRGAALAAAGG